MYATAAAFSTVIFLCIRLGLSLISEQVQRFEEKTRKLRTNAQF